MFDRLHSHSYMEPNFFILEEPEPGSPQDKAHGTRALKVEGFSVGPAPVCPACGRFVGLLRWLPPFRVELETWGKEFGDVMLTGDELLVSERFKETYTKDGLSGLLRFEPVEVVKVKRHRKFVGAPPRYFKAEVVRSDTMVDQLASGAEWDSDQEECAVCLLRKGTFLRRKRVVIKPETWTGHDIFHARGGVNFVASERMKEICEAHGIKNAVWIPANDHEVDVYPTEAKLIRGYLKVFEDKNEQSAARQEAYRTLVFAVDKNWDRIPKGRFDPDKDADPAVIAAAKALAAVDG